MKKYLSFGYVTMLVLLGLIVVNSVYADSNNNGANNATSSTDSIVNISMSEPDKTSPVIDRHSDILGIEATSASGTPVTFEVLSTDDVDGILPADCAPHSGSLFGLGSTLVSCNKIDSNGNVAFSSKFHVEVVDKTAPVITLNGANPQLIIINSPYQELGATVTDNANAGLVATINASGVNVDALGDNYFVIYSATDSTGNTATTTRVVHVVEKPVVVVPPVVDPVVDPVAATSTSGDGAGNNNGTGDGNSSNNSDSSGNTGASLGSSLGSSGSARSSSGSSGSYLQGFESLFGGGVQGSVLGTSTEASSTSSSTCELFKSFLKRGGNNDGYDVVKLQRFLNQQLGLNIPLTGIFGSQTEKAVKAYQLKNSDSILAPWVKAGYMKNAVATGYFYKSTQYSANKVLCPSLVTADLLVK